MPTYTEKKRAGLVPLASYDLNKRPLQLRIDRTEANRHQTTSYMKFLRLQSWRANLITVDGSQPYTQALPEVRHD